MHKGRTFVDVRLSLPASRDWVFAPAQTWQRAGLEEMSMTRQSADNAEQANVLSSDAQKAADAGTQRELSHSTTIAVPVLMISATRSWQKSLYPICRRTLHFGSACFIFREICPILSHILAHQLSDPHPTRHLPEQCV